MGKSLAKVDKANELVQRLETSFGTALPSHVTKEHFSRALLTEFRRNPGLVECDPKTIATGVVTCAQLGLMIGVNGAAWLVPFNNRKAGGKEAVLFIGYQGIVDLVYRSERVESLSADVVCENDEFEYEQGLHQKLLHKPYLKGDRGNPYAVYAIANVKGSYRPVFVVLNRNEVIAVKDSSPAARKSDSPWNGPFEAEMWKKTALRRLCKFLPKSVELNRALEYENRQEERIRETEATVVHDDPFSEGTQSTRRKEPEPVPDSQDINDVLESIEIMAETDRQAVVEVMRKFGLPDLPEIVPSQLDAEQELKLYQAHDEIKSLIE